jgi:hypothetical protein
MPLETSTARNAAISKGSEQVCFLYHQLFQFSTSKGSPNRSSIIANILQIYGTCDRLFTVRLVQVSIEYNIMYHLVVCLLYLYKSLGSTTLGMLRFRPITRTRQRHPPASSPFMSFAV